MPESCQKVPIELQIKGNRGRLCKVQFFHVAKQETDCIKQKIAVRQAKNTKIVQKAKEDKKKSKEEDKRRRKQYEKNLKIDFLKRKTKIDLYFNRNVIERLCYNNSQSVMQDPYLL